MLFSIKKLTSKIWGDAVLFNSNERKLQHRSMFMLAAGLCLGIAGCSDIAETPEYQAACHGKPLKKSDRMRAREDGYVINEQYQCIDKASYTAMQEAEARWQAAHTPEAIAKSKTEDQARIAQLNKEMAQREARRKAEQEAKLALRYELHLVEINQASAAELAKVCSIDKDAAESIIQERANGGPFKDWADAVHRVIALSSAQNAVFASTCGLTVNGASFNGVPADEEAAQMIFQRGLR